MATSKTNNSSKTTTNADLAKVHESKVDSPVEFVRKFVIANHKKLGRAGCVRALVEKHKVAFFTARTQYQKVHALGYKMPKPANKAQTAAK